MAEKHGKLFVEDEFLGASRDTPSMTLDELIHRLQTWRDLKKVGDAPVQVLDFDSNSYFDLISVTFGADGTVYLEADEPPDHSLEMDWQPAPTAAHDVAPFDGRDVLLAVPNWLGTAYTLPTIIGCGGKRLDPDKPCWIYIGRWTGKNFVTTETQYEEFLTVELSEVWRWAAINMPEVADG